MALDVKSFVDAQRAFFFAWKEWQSVPHDRGLFTHARTTHRTLTEAHDTIQRRMISRWNPLEIVHIVPKTNYREVQRLDEASRDWALANLERSAAMLRDDTLLTACENRLYLWRRTHGSWGLSTNVEMGTSNLFEVIGLTPLSNGRIAFVDSHENLVLWDPQHPMANFEEVGTTDGVRSAIVREHADGNLITLSIEEGVIEIWLKGGDHFVRHPSVLSLGPYVNDIQFIDASWHILVSHEDPNSFDQIDVQGVMENKRDVQTEIHGAPPNIVRIHIRTPDDWYLAHEDNENGRGGVVRMWVDEDGERRTESLFQFEAFECVGDVQVLPDDRILLAIDASVRLYGRGKDDRYEQLERFDIGQHVRMARAISDGTIIAVTDRHVVHIFDGEPV